MHDSLRPLRHPATTLVLIAALIVTTDAPATAARLITGAQVRDGSLSTKDLSRSARRSLTGRQGPAGPAGVAGAPGASGARGADGAAGGRGETGARGPQGSEGPKGDKGDKGDTGETGPAGPTASAHGSSTTDATLGTVTSIPVVTTSITIAVRSRLVTAGVAEIRSDGGGDDEANCTAQAGNLALAGSAMNATIPVRTTIPVTGSVVYNPGTYEVVLKCAETTGNTTFEEGELTVIAVASP